VREDHAHSLYCCSASSDTTAAKNYFANCANNRFGAGHETASRSHPADKKTGNITTPELNQNSPETPYEMGRDIGGQAESIGGIKQSVKDLQDKREKIDRPDIDDLKQSRNHIEWTSSILVSVLSTLIVVLWYFKRIIWHEILIPRISRVLSHPTGPQEPT
jgi:hypothetical protein